jgi:hypothetical protein
VIVEVEVVPVASVGVVRARSRRRFAPSALPLDAPHDSHTRDKDNPVKIRSELR